MADQGLSCGSAIQLMRYPRFASRWSGMFAVGERKASAPAASRVPDRLLRIPSSANLIPWLSAYACGDVRRLSHSARYNQLCISGNSSVRAVNSPSMRRTAGMRCQKDAQHCLRKSQRFGSSPRHPGKSSTVRDREKRLVLNLTGEGLRKVPLLKPMTGHGCGLCE